MNLAFTVGVVGNPNCGKTSLFNTLTGSKHQVGNWPGVTVEKKTGHYQHNGYTISLVDLPGTYSLESEDDSVSLDEKIARDYVASREADLIINILDASNIERNLYLSSQLIEMRVPMIVVLNMMDAVQREGVIIDHIQLSQKLGCPVVPVSAAKGMGIHALLATINQACEAKPIPLLSVPYHSAIESAVSELESQITANNCDRRWLALRLIENDTLALKLCPATVLAKLEGIRQNIEVLANEEIDILAADARYGLVNQLVTDCVFKHNQVSKNISERIDHIVLNRFLGIPIFLMVMYSMFMFTINIGNIFVDFFDQIVGAFLVDGLNNWLHQLNWPDWLIVILSQGFGGGIQVVATFVPIVGFLFIFLSILEDSGYMSRAAFVMDRFMCLIGLPGKSFVPMIIGFGCNVPAIIATRTLDNPRDRILTNLMNPFMSCGARLPVYALFAAAFFPVGGQNLVFGLYLFGILIAVLTGLIMRHTLLRGKAAPFLMELPNYHWPSLQSVYIKTWERLKGFIVNAGKVIVPMVLVLNILNSWGMDGSFGKENSQQSVLSEIGRQLTPLFRPMGIQNDNWPATVGIFTGVLAKEAVVGTLDALYSQMAVNTAEETPEEFILVNALLKACTSVTEHILELADRVLDPLGMNLGDLADTANIADKQQVKLDTYAVMQSQFDGTEGAFAYLLFILLYTPCVAATAAIYRETSPGWAAFTVCWTTGIAYLTATAYYQFTQLAIHPLASFSWLIGSFVLVVVLIAMLHYYGRRKLVL